MYKIIGADGREYGPVTAEQLRQWIREGRANAETRVQAEGSADWTTLGSIAEFRDSFPVTNIPATPGVATGTSTLDVSRCVSRSWGLIKDNFGMIVGTTFLIYLILMVGGIGLRIAVNAACGVTFQDILYARGLRAIRLQWPGIFVSSLWFWIMTGPLVGGLYSFFLKLIRGQPATVADAFAGFGPQFGHLVLGSFIVSFLVTVGVLFCLVPGIFLAVIWKFTLPSIIDKQLGFWEGLETSRRAVAGRWWHVFALVLLAGLIGGAGIFVCCIGIFVTFPITLGAIAYAYEDLIGVSVPASR